MAQKAISYNGIAGAVCTLCYTAIFVVVVGAHHTARLSYCPAVTETGYFCEAPLVDLDIEQIDAALQSYVDLNLAGKSGDSEE